MAAVVGCTAHKVQHINVCVVCSVCVCVLTQSPYFSCRDEWVVWSRGLHVNAEFTQKTTVLVY